jgi:hypothetical protein
VTFSNTDFTGFNKPWLQRNQKRIKVQDIVHRVQKSGKGWDALNSPHELWFFLFWQVHQKFKMDNLVHSQQIHKQYQKEHIATDVYPQQVLKGLNIVDMHDFRIPRLKLGGFPTYGMMTNVIHARTGRSVKHVENFNAVEKRRKQERQRVPLAPDIESVSNKSRRQRAMERLGMV